MIDDLDRLAADLTQAGLTAAVRMVPIVHKGANNVQREARELAPKGAVARHYPASITYDVTIGAGTITAEIGPDKDKPQGPLGNIFEYGAPAQDKAPIQHLGPALAHEAPRFETYVADVGGSIL